jgi:hypothetical protein
VRGGKWRWSASQPRVVTEKNLSPRGYLVAGTPRQATFDEYMVQVRADLVRAELIGRTTVELGQACNGSDRGFLGPRGELLHLHVTDHLGA